MKGNNVKNNGEIIIYETEDGNTKIDVNLVEETIWLNQQDLVNLYKTSKSNISEHIKNIFEEGELEEKSVVRNFRTTANDGKIYNEKYFINKRIIESLKYIKSTRYAKI